MGLFDILEPTFLKESSDLEDQIHQLTEILPKASPYVQEVIRQDLKLLEAGFYGENQIVFELKNSHLPIYVLRDLYIEHGDLSAQIDFMVIAPKCTYLLECKNLFGNIEINKNGDFIRTLQFGKHYKKEGIYSPITQNERHLELIKAIELESRKKRLLNMFLGDITSKAFVPIVVLANEKTVLNDRFAPKSIKQKIVRLDRLVSYIKQYEASANMITSSTKDMKEIAENWLSLSSEDRTDHIEKYRNMERELRQQAKQSEKTEIPQQKLENKSELICPKCGSKMILRTATKGERTGKQFWGCSTFPKCKCIINIE